MPEPIEIASPPQTQQVGFPEEPSEPISIRRKPNFVERWVLNTYRYGPLIVRAALVTTVGVAMMASVRSMQRVLVPRVGINGYMAAAVGVGALLSLFIIATASWVVED